MSEQYLWDSAEPTDISTASVKDLCVFINVKTTHRDLVWGSVAVGESSSKFFTVVSEDSCRLSVYLQDTLHSYVVPFTFKQKLSNS
jgi:hypothetical protein